MVIMQEEEEEGRQGKGGKIGPKRVGGEVPNAVEEPKAVDTWDDGEHRCSPLVERVLYWIA